MRVLRRYQIDIIFLFVALITLVAITFFLLKYWGADPHDYEWFAIGPLILFYIVYLLSIRKKIHIMDRRQLTGKSLTYWLVLGITLVASYSSPITARAYWSINLFFIIFTLLLADSYWDFKNITMKNLVLNKKKLDKI